MPPSLREYVVNIILKANDQTAAAVTKAAAEIEGLNKLQDENTRRSQSARREAENLAKSYENSARAIDRNKRSMQDIKKANDDVIAAQLKLEQAARNQERVFADGNRTLAEREQASRRTQKATDDLAGAIERTSSADRAAAHDRANFIRDTERMNEVARMGTRSVQEAERAHRAEQTAIRSKARELGNLDENYRRAVKDLKEMKGGSQIFSDITKEARNLAREGKNVEAAIGAIKGRPTEAVKAMAAEVLRLDQEMRRAGTSISSVQRSLGEFENVGQALGSTLKSIGSFDLIPGRWQAGLAAILPAIPILTTLLDSLGGALASVASSAALAGSALGGALVAGIGQAIPVVSVGVAAFSQLTGVFKALSEADKQQQADATGATSAANKQANASDAVANAQDTLKNATDGVSNAYGSLKDAQDNVTKAELNLKNAEDQLSVARFQAKRQLQDLINAEKDARLAAQGAAISQTQAQSQLRRAILGGGDLNQLAQARLGVAQANQQVTETTQAHARAQQDLNNQLSGNIYAPDQQIKQAQAGVASATEEVQKSQVALAKAQDGVTKAENSVARAQRDLAKAQRTGDQAATATNAATRQLDYMLSKMDASQRKLYNDLSGIQDQARKLANTLGDPIINALDRAAHKASSLLSDHRLTGALQGLSNRMGAGLSRVIDTLFGPTVQHALLRLTQLAGPNIDRISRTASNLIDAFARIAVAASPILADILTRVESVSKHFDKWTQDTTGLNNFFRAAKQNFDAWLNVAGALGGVIAKIIQDLTDPQMGAGNKGGAFVGILNSAADSLNRMTAWLSTQGGAAKVREFVNASLSVLGNVLHLIWDIIKALSAAFDPEATKAFVTLLQMTLVPMLSLALSIISSIEEVIGWIIQHSPEPIRKLMVAIGGIAGAILLLRKIPGGKYITDAMIEGLGLDVVGKKITSGIVSIFAGLRTALVAPFKALWTLLGNHALDAWTGIGIKMQRAWTTLWQWMGTAAGAITRALAVVGNLIASAFGAAFSIVRGLWTTFWGWLAERVAAIPALDAIASAVAGAFTKGLNAAKRVWGAFWNWLTENGARQKAKQVAASTEVGAASAEAQTVAEKEKAALGETEVQATRKETGLTEAATKGAAMGEEESGAQTAAEVRLAPAGETEAQTARRAVGVTEAGATGTEEGIAQGTAETTAMKSGAILGAARGAGIVLGMAAAGYLLNQFFDQIQKGATGLVHKVTGSGAAAGAYGAATNAAKSIIPGVGVYNTVRDITSGKGVTGQDVGSIFGPVGSLAGSAFDALTSGQSKVDKFRSTMQKSFQQFQQEGNTAALNKLAQQADNFARSAGKGAGALQDFANKARDAAEKVRETRIYQSLQAQMLNLRDASRRGLQPVLSLLDSLPPAARRQAAGMLENMAQQMQASGLLPAGAADKIKKLIERHLDGAGIGQRAADAMNNALSNSLVAAAAALPGNQGLKAYIQTIQRLMNQAGIPTSRIPWAQVPLNQQQQQTLGRDINPFARRQTGGPVGGGYGGGDKIDAKLEPGEFVMRKEAVRAYGMRFMEMINSVGGRMGSGHGGGKGHKFQQGGQVQQPQQQQQQQRKGQKGDVSGSVTLDFSDSLDTVKKFIDDFEKLWKGLWDDIHNITHNQGGKLQDQFNHLHDNVLNILNDMSGKGQNTVNKMIGNMGNSFHGLVHSVGVNMTNLDNVVYQGFQYLQTAANQALQAVGADHINLKVTAPGKKRGGYVGEQGERGSDLIPTWLGRGEAVLNWAHQKLVDPAMRAFYGFGLGDMFDNTSAEHAGGGAPGHARGGYVNPYAHAAGFSPGRTDEGYDAVVAGRIDAIGDSVVTYAGGPAGWPGTGAVVYKLLSGQYGGRWVYLAENIRPTVHPGQHLNAGDQIAIAVPSFPYTEMGWASGPNWAAGTQTLAKATSGYSEGQATPAGQQFAAVLGSLGVQGASGNIHANIGAAAAVAQIKHAIVHGKGPMKQLAQKIIDKVTEAINNKISSTSTSGTGGDIGGNWSGTWVQVMEQIAKKMGWSLPDWKQVINLESGGNPNSVNASSGAYGLGQFLPMGRSQYPKAFSHNPVDQIEAMAQYIKDRYGNPTQALAHEHSSHWYEKGGELPGEGQPLPIVAHGGEWILNRLQQSKVARWMGTTRDTLRGALGFDRDPSQRSFQDGGEVITSRSERRGDPVVIVNVNLGALQSRLFGNYPGRETVGGITDYSRGSPIQKFLRTATLPGITAKSTTKDFLSKWTGIMNQFTAEAATQYLNLAKQDLHRLARRPSTSATKTRIETLRAYMKKLVDNLLSLPDATLDPTDLGQLSVISDRVKMGLNKLPTQVKKMDEFFKGLNTLTAQDTGVFALMDQAFSTATTRLQTGITLATNGLKYVRDKLGVRHLVPDAFITQSQALANQIAGDDDILTSITKERAAVVTALDKVNKRIQMYRGKKSDAAFQKLMNQRNALIGEMDTVDQNIASARADRYQAILDKFNQDTQDALRPSTTMQTIGNTILGIGQAVGNFAQMAQGGQIVLSALQQQRDVLQQRFNEANAKAQTDPRFRQVADDLFQQLAGAIQGVAEQQIANLTNQIQAVSQRLQFQQGATNLLNRLAAVQQLTNPLQAIRMQQMGAAVNQSHIQDALNQAYGLADQFGGYGNLAWTPFDQLNTAQQQLVTTIQDLQGQLAENTAQMRDLTATYRQTATDLINQRIATETGYTSAAGQIFQNIAQITGGSTQSEQLRAAQQQQGILGNQAGQIIGNIGSAISGGEYGSSALGILAQLLGAFQKGPGAFANMLTTVSSSIQGIETGMSDAQRTAFEAMIQSMIDNTDATQQNTIQIQTLNGSMMQPQGFSTTAWQWFRQAIFTGMGDVLPQFQIPQMQTGGYVTKKGIFELHAGEHVINPNGNNTPMSVQEGDTNITVHEAGGPVDVTHLAARFAFEKKRSNRGRV